MNAFTVFGNAMVNGKKFYEDHVTFHATSFEDAIKIAKDKYMSMAHKTESIIDDFIPVSIMNGYVFEDDAEIRKI